MDDWKKRKEETSSFLTLEKGFLKVSGEGIRNNDELIFKCRTGEDKHCRKQTKTRRPQLIRHREMKT